jgi:predicted O-methyltransferase YrrM
LARVLYERRPPSAGQKLFLAVQSYEGIGAGCAYTLFHFGQALKEAGIDVELSIYTGNCHVDDGRNRLVRDFLLSDCTDMVFMDADVGCPASNLIQLLSYDVDVVAGIYPKKGGDDQFPVKMLPGEIWSDAQGLIEVQGVPTGFLRMRRNVLVRLSDRAVHYNARNDASSAIPLIFERQVHDGTRWGGDYVFCRKWRAAGGKIHIAPEMRFEHSGMQTWSGRVGAWLREKNGLGLKLPLERIRAGKDTAEDYLDLFDAYGNPYAAVPTLLFCLATMARKFEHVVEFGSGLSTLVLQAACRGKVRAYENNPIYADHIRGAADNLGLEPDVKYAALNGGWYDIGISQLDLQPGTMVFIDGPRGGDGRPGVFGRVDLSKATVVVDDVQSNGGMPVMVETLRKTHRVEIIEDSNMRHFCVAVPK